MFLARSSAKAALLETSLLREAALLLARLQLRLGTAFLRLEAHVVLEWEGCDRGSDVVVACVLTWSSLRVASEAIRMLARSAVTREAAAACCLLLLLKEDAPECETRKNAFLAP